MAENPPQANNESDVSKKETVKEDKSTTITEDSLFERSKELGDVFTDEEVELLEKLRTGNNPEKLEKMDKIVSGIEDRERNKNKGDQTNQDSPLVESNPDPDAESVLDSPKNKEQETVIGEEATKDTVVEKGSPSPIEIWNKLINEKKEISRKISSGELSEKEGAEAKINISWQIIEQGCHIFGVDSSGIRGKVEAELEKQWKTSLEDLYGKNGDAEKKYQAQQRENVERIALNKEADKVMDEKWSKLSEAIKGKYNNNIEQFKQNYFESTRNEIFRRTADDEGKNGILLSKEAFCGMIRQGFNPEDIRPANYWQVIKHSIGRLAVFDTFVSLSKGPLLSISSEKAEEKEKTMGWAEFKKFVSESENSFKQGVFEKAGDLDQEAQKRTQKNKKSAVEQFVLDKNIKELQEVLLQEQKQKRIEKAEKTEQKNKEKREEAEVLPVDKRMKLVNNLRNIWKDAEKIDKAVKTGKRIKTKNGKDYEFFDPKIEEQKQELIESREALSDEIIKIANQLTGRNLKQEAKEKTGYVFDKENLDEEKQKEFREWLTKEVKKIFADQIKKIEEQTEKKVRFKKKVKE
jgi:hypothetical protein